MFEFYITYQLFNEDELKEIDELLLRDSDLFWEDGLRSTSHNNKNIKNNLELLPNTELYNNLNTKVKQNIYNNINFTHFTIPEHSSKCIFSKTPIGGYYNVHHDSPEVGNFSTTIFLSNKDDYEGGELLLKIGNNVKSIKLEKGYAVTYNTGIEHSVKEVTKGERLVGIFWTSTSVKDYNLRYIHSIIGEIGEIIKKKYPEEIKLLEGTKDIYDVDDSVLFKVQSAREYIERISL